MGGPDRPIVMSIVQYSDAIESGRMSALELVERGDELGVHGVELRRELWGDGMNEELPAVRQRIKALGRQITFATHSVLFSEGEDYDLLLADVDTASEIRSPHLRIFSGPVPKDANDPAWEKARAVIDRAEKKGILIALENFSGEPGGTLAEIQTVLNYFPVSALKTNIDTGNYAGWNQDLLEAIDAIGDRVAYVHVKDPSKGGTSVPGEGDLPMKEIFVALDALPQEIIYCFEFPGGSDPDDRIRRGLAFMKNR